ncbi:innexin inx2 [Nephila pilipes]|uniref:Innexin n=1 Tax=Nephila pilipes TaxID=299642 RepID=A0A8X6UGE1_NEPPI|nr:innexin inx2 [Nephila pilipes]
MDLFSNLKSFFKTSGTIIDNNVFRLHYKVTSILLVAFSILVTARQYIGDPIDCITSQEKGIPENMLDTFCWVHSTFSLPDSWEKNVGEEIPYPGVGTTKNGQKRIYHAYYQWVCFVLFLQAILFYVPRYFWKSVENGRIKSLILGLNSPCLTEEVKNNNKKLLVEYLVTNLNNHTIYFMSFLFAEILNFVNVIGQIFLINCFLGGEFSAYGIKVLQFTGWDGSLRYDPMIHVFPRLTKCNFHKFGSGGSIELIDAMCILPINIINEKIYIFLWFWFILLATLSSLSLVYRLVIIFWPRSRFLVTSFRARLVSHDHLYSVLSKFKLGDWFILDLLSKNLESLNFKDVVNDVAERLDSVKYF